MSGALIVIVGLIYAGVATDQFLNGHTGMGLMYVGYAVGNIGAWMLVK